MTLSRLRWRLANAPSELDVGETPT